MKPTLKDSAFGDIFASNPVVTPPPEPREKISFSLNSAAHESGMHDMLTNDAYGAVASRWHILTLIGTPDAVATAMYRTSLTPGGYVGDDGTVIRTGAGYSHQDAIRLNAGEFSLLALDPPVSDDIPEEPHGMAGLPSWKIQDEDNLPDEAPVSPARLEVRFEGRWQSTLLEDVELMQAWSVQCPHVQFTCALVQNPRTEMMAFTVQEGRLIQMATIQQQAAHPKPLKVVGTRNWHDLWVGKWFKLYSGLERTGDDPTPIAHMSKPLLIARPPDHIARLLRGGPDCLAEMVELGKRSDVPLDGGGSQLPSWNGITAIDATIMSGEITQRQLTGPLSDCSPITKVDPERINRLSALSVTNNALATLLGTEFGRTANGCHVIALMARAALPNSIEALGVKNVLDRCAWRPPTVLDLSNQDADRRTATALLKSGNRHSWAFLEKHQDPAMLKGYGAHAALHFAEDVMAYCAAYGTEHFDAIDEATFDDALDAAVAALEDARHAQESVSVMRAVQSGTPTPAVKPRRVGP
jgi:hypothetical protein